MTLTTAKENGMKQRMILRFSQIVPNERFSFGAHEEIFTKVSGTTAIRLVDGRLVDFSVYELVTI